jgi:hypothetical protein
MSLEMKAPAIENVTESAKEDEEDWDAEFNINTNERISNNNRISLIPASNQQDRKASDVKPLFPSNLVKQ